jgi:hypothetical protein
MAGGNTDFALTLRIPLEKNTFSRLEGMRIWHKNAKNPAAAPTA